MFTQNDAVAAYAEAVFASHPDEFRELLDEAAPCRIAYVHSDREKKSNGRTVYADTTKVSDLMKALCHFDFVICFYGPACEDLPEAVLELLMYHELLHVGYEPRLGKCWLIPHDIEDFDRIIRRYGIDWIHGVGIDADSKGE